MPETIHTIVFQARAGGGNPCPVTLNADELTVEQMQSMSHDFGAESAFLMRPARPDCEVKVRYFLPLHETDMCMHATVGSATALVRRGICKKSPILFETNLGPMQVEWGMRDGNIDVAVEQYLLQYQQAAPTAGEVCKALGITPDSLADGPIQSVSTSRFKLMVPLSSKSVLDGLEPDFELLWALCDRYETTGFYPFALEDGNVLYARQFPKRAGYDEDPATGVAASALAAYLAKHRRVLVWDGWNCFTVFQGEKMGRPSVIYADVFMENGNITRTRIRGNAVILETMKGEDRL